MQAWEEIEAQIAKAVEDAGDVICLGDFNIDRKRIEDHSYYLLKLGKRYKKFLATQGLEDHDYGYTWMRCHEDGTVRRSAIDQCFTKSSKLIKEHQKVELSFTDHCMIMADLITGPWSKGRRKVWRRDLKKIRKNPDSIGI